MSFWSPVASFTPDETLFCAQRWEWGLVVMCLKIAALSDQKCGCGQLHLAEFPSGPERKQLFQEKDCHPVMLEAVCSQSGAFWMFWNAGFISQDGIQRILLEHKLITETDMMRDVAVSADAPVVTFALGVCSCCSFKPHFTLTVVCMCFKLQLNFLLRTINQLFSPGVFNPLLQLTACPS